MLTSTRQTFVSGILRVPAGVRPASDLVVIILFNLCSLGEKAVKVTPGRQNNCTKTQNRCLSDSNSSLVKFVSGMKAKQLNHRFYQENIK